MERLKFDSNGRIIAIDNAKLDIFINGDGEDDEQGYGEQSLRTSESLGFLKNDEINAVNVKEREYWSLYSDGKLLDPLRFSNGKSQEDVVKEVVDLIKQGSKIIFIHGVCGTGKCLGGGSRVFCKPEEEQNFCYYKISDLVGKRGKILSVDGAGNIKESDFKNVISSGTKKLYKLKTRTGREIIASANHPFLSITSNGVEWMELDKLSNKSYICLPNLWNLSRLSDLEDPKIKILAHLIAEGKLGDLAGSPKYYQNDCSDHIVREDYKNALKNLFPEGEVRERGDEITLVFRNMDTSHGTTNKLRLFIREYGLDGKKSGEKFVPSVIFNLEREKVALFLRTLFSGDGAIYFRNNASKNTQFVIEYDSISKRLIQDVSLLLGRFGIQHTIGSHGFRDKADYSWRITMSNQEQVVKYIEEIGFIGRRQELALDILKKCKKHKFTNIDKVPRLLRDYLKEKGYSYNELDRYLNYDKIENLRKSFGFKKIIKHKMTETPCVFKQGKIDFLRCHLEKVNNYLKDDVLSFICNKNILWDRVVSIDYLKEDETYDLEVSEHHNFIADGIIVHNSAIALNIARALGRASIVVPIKSLQRQYEEDYMKGKYLLKDGKRMKIAMITGRDNHDSIIEPGKSCADPFLPDTIKFTDKNYNLLWDYYQKNPLIKNRVDALDVKNLKRISVAPANPYWSPIVADEFEMPLRDAKKRKYRGLNGMNFVFYHRKSGCSYYDQYLSYLDADIIIFNSAKYKIENALNRKPETDVEIIDEADEFLDSFSTQEEINLTRLAVALKNIYPDDEDARYALDQILEHIKLEERNKSALGINEDLIYHIKETQLDKILRLFIKNPELEVELALDELNYGNKGVEAAKEFKEFLEDTYATFRRKENDLYANLVTTNLSRKFQEIVKKNKALVLMSGTLHSELVLKEIFGIENFKVVEAETYQPGTIEIVKTGKEIDCKYSNFSSNRHSREDYLMALNEAVSKAKKPMLVHVNAFEDLPSNDEMSKFGINGLMSREKLRELQANDKTGRLVSLFKAKLADNLYSTKCSRGVDFPGDVCNSVIFTKYPNPNVRGTFWRILQKTHPSYYWDFYRDKARREFLQRIYRAVRSKDDHVFVLSPDSRVLDAVKELQNGKLR